ncbi:hypothetical protein [Halpernia sp.]|uniref:hypothetical protein n=1 Tax=Halpernia sp. TaxID=2782209 RepID=UPI003A8E7EC9
MSLPFLHHLKKEIKKEIKFQIFRQNLDMADLVKFNEKDLKNAHWKEDEEFILNHLFYDVVSIKTKNGEKIYYCFKDKKETKIVQIETEIRNFIVGSKFNTPEAKPYFAKIFKVNPVSKKIPQTFSLLEENQFLKSNYQYYHNSIKVSDFIDKFTIPPEV